MSPCADSDDLPDDVAIGVIVLICVFVSAFAWSWGPLGWLVIPLPGADVLATWHAEGRPIACTLQRLSCSDC
jgi:hypothetical protein